MPLIVSITGHLDTIHIMIFVGTLFGLVSPPASIEEVVLAKIVCVFATSLSVFSTILSVFAIF